MALYTLKVNSDLSQGVLEKVESQDVDYEKDFENWLENSPHVLPDGDEGGGLIWIGRQVTAAVGDTGKFPDLVGINAAGDLVIVELKKGRTPRDVVAQVLEYAAWGSTLTYGDLNEIAQRYFTARDGDCNCTLLKKCQEVFAPDSGPEFNMEFNRGQKLYVVAEEISPVIRQVAQYLRTTFGVNIYCLEYKVLQSRQGDFFISTERIVGFTTPATSRWSEPVKVKTAVAEAVQRLTKGNPEAIFTPADVYHEVAAYYPGVNRATVGCQVIADCVNHTSRKHYPGGQQDLYYRVDTGRFRLYNPETDGKWDSRGRRVDPPK